MSLFRPFNLKTDLCLSRWTWITIALMVILVVFLQGCGSGKAKSVTFSTPDPAPPDFDSWTFDYSYPRWDQDAHLTLVVQLPDGRDVFETPIEQAPPFNPNPAGHLELSPNIGGIDQSVFYGKKVKVTFRVDKGFLLFPLEGYYTFAFYEGGVGMTKLGQQTAVREGM